MPPPGYLFTTRIHPWCSLALASCHGVAHPFYAFAFPHMGKRRESGNPGTARRPHGRAKQTGRISRRWGDLTGCKRSPPCPNRHGGRTGGAAELRAPSAKTALAGGPLPHQPAGAGLSAPPAAADAVTPTQQHATGLALPPGSEKTRPPRKVDLPLARKPCSAAANCTAQCA